MSADLNSSVVRVYSNNGKVVGAGFLVSQKHILTCAHVIADALGIDRNTAEMPNALLHLDFPLLDREPKPSFTARIVFWRPVNPNNFAEDIAALELENSPPTDAKPAPLVTSKELWGHTFRVVGFPKNKPNGVWASGEIKAGLANGWVQLEDTKQQGYALEPGFSGAPIWDEQLQGVAGMAVAAEMERAAAKVAFIIPTQVLVQVTGWPVIPYTLLPNISLPSMCEADYAQLQDLLKNQKFQEADEETFKKLLWLAKRENEGWLRETDILNLPEKDLHTIDQLWLASSNGKFGFSIQKQIWNDVEIWIYDVGGSTEINYLEVVEYFFLKLNWIGDDMRLNPPNPDLNSSIKGNFPQKYLAKEIIQYVLKKKAIKIRTLYETLKTKIRNLRILDILEMYIKEGEDLENLFISGWKEIETKTVVYEIYYDFWRWKLYDVFVRGGESKDECRSEEKYGDISKEFRIWKEIQEYKDIEQRINSIERTIDYFLEHDYSRGSELKLRELKEYYDLLCDAIKEKKGKEKDKLSKMKEIEKLFIDEWEEEKGKAKAKATEARGRIDKFLNRIKS